MVVLAVSGKVCAAGTQDTRTQGFQLHTDAQELMMNRVERARHRIEARIYQDAIGEPPSDKWKMIVPFFMEHGFAARVLRKRLGLSTPLNTTDRIVLEQVIFPHYSQDAAIRKMLFVGCGTYTAHYQRLFFPQKDFWTIEPDPGAARHGARQHIIAPLEELERHFPENEFDLIICNGVFGWGLDRHDQCEAAFSQCHSRLARDGQFLFGWDDVARRTPVALETISSLTRFRPYTFPPLRTSRYVTETPYRHTYAFYRK
jgi:SAM-dependent methyltransferase